MTIKPGQSIRSLSEAEAPAVLNHPAQKAAVPLITQLITWLRECKTPEDCYEFQRELFARLYEVEERRAQCSRVIKRFADGKKPPGDVPPPPSVSGGASQLPAWQLESFVFERLARQIRTVGDGFAWTCFGYDRRIILALCRNASPGPMYGKTGLPYELGAINELWESRGHFALHHDLTNCLRIADLTEFTADGRRLLHEVKAKPRAERRQIERMQAAVDAIMRGGVLPNSIGDSRLVQLDEPYRTDLQPLNDLLQLARRNGCHGMKLPQGRALFAASLPVVASTWKDNPAEGNRVMTITRQQALKRAGIDKVMHHIKGYSGDTAARSPIMAPWSIYPFSAPDCAELICDLLFFDTTASADDLVESLEEAGLTGEVLLKPADVSLEGAMPVVRASWRNRTVTWHAEGLNALLYELAEPDTLARGIREVLHMDSPPDYPVLVYRNEETSWFPARPKGPGTR